MIAIQPNVAKKLHKMNKKALRQPEVDIKLIRETAWKIVTEIFGKKYTIDNSQTQRFIKEMLQKAGVKIKE